MAGMQAVVQRPQLRSYPSWFLPGQGGRDSGQLLNCPAGKPIQASFSYLEQERQDPAFSGWGYCEYTEEKYPEKSCYGRGNSSVGLTTAAALSPVTTSGYPGPGEAAFTFRGFGRADWRSCSGRVPTCPYSASSLHHLTEPSRC